MGKGGHKKWVEFNWTLDNSSVQAQLIAIALHCIYTGDPCESWRGSRFAQESFVQARNCHAIKLTCDLKTDSIHAISCCDEGVKQVAQANQAAKNLGLWLFSLYDIISLGWQVFWIFYLLLIGIQARFLTLVVLLYPQLNACSKHHSQEAVKKALHVAVFFEIICIACHCVFFNTLLITLKLDFCADSWWTVQSENLWTSCSQIHASQDLGFIILLH